MKQGSAGEYAYSANKISQWLTEAGFKHRPRSSKVDGFVLYDHGLCVEFAAPEPSEQFISMSIQTHPTISGSDFAESAMFISSKTMISPGCLGYIDDIIRHQEPEDLYRHIQQVALLVSDKETFKKIVELIKT